MCNYFSCVIDKNLKAYYLLNTSSHEDIIASTQLKDDKLENRDFVRVEITPLTDVPTRNKKDWKFSVDEEESLPEWYTKAVRGAEEACWRAWRESVQVQLALGTEEHTVTDTVIFGYEQAKIVGSGNCTIVGSGNCTIVGYDNCIIEGSGNCTIEGYDNCTIEGYGNCTIRNYSSNTKVQLLSTTATMISNGKIYVSPIAIVKIIVVDETSRSLTK